MNIQEVIKKIGINRLQAFYRFMGGQTVGVDKNGDCDYFEQDVENFLRKPKDRFWD